MIERVCTVRSQGYNQASGDPEGGILPATVPGGGAYDRHRPWRRANRTKSISKIQARNNAPIKGSS